LINIVDLNLFRIARLGNGLSIPQYQFNYKYHQKQPKQIAFLIQLNASFAPEHWPLTPGPCLSACRSEA